MEHDWSVCEYRAHPKAAVDWLLHNPDGVYVGKFIDEDVAMAVAAVLSEHPEDYRGFLSMIIRNQPF